MLSLKVKLKEHELKLFEASVTVKVITVSVFTIELEVGNWVTVRG